MANYLSDSELGVLFLFLLVILIALILIADNHAVTHNARLLQRMKEEEEKEKEKTQC